MQDKNYDIVLQNISKQYSKCKNDLERLLTLFGFYKKHKLTVLDSISFKIKKGEKVALVGKNGSGKSTILKIISNITVPTSGKVTVNRRISTLIEVTAGLYYEFSARENLFLRATLLGLSKHEIKEIEDKIFDFAGIDDNFKDQQLKRFSSGMIAKLGFAINLFSKPEILIVDEALAVNDEEFKNKCKLEIQKISKSNDVTLIFVSHDQKTVEEFCDRGILINNKKILLDGPIKEVFKQYKHISKEK